MIDTAMLMAAGLGKRMRPLTATRPKPLVKVAGKPLMDHALDRLAAGGIRKVVVNVHYLADTVEAHLRAQPNGMEVLISDERAKLLETGGGLIHARHLLGDQPFFCANSDNLWIDGPQETLGMMGISLFGTCTMKYNSRLSEAIAARPEIAEMHPLQDEETLQGILKIIHDFDLILRELSGMDQFVFQPAGGADAAYTHACVTRAWLAARGELGKRDEIITSLQAHPCNPAIPIPAHSVPKNAMNRMPEATPPICARVTIDEVCVM